MTTGRPKRAKVTPGGVAAHRTPDQMETVPTESGPPEAAAPGSQPGAQHDPMAALELIKEAHRHPKPLTKAEAIDFITRPIYLGMPTLQRKPGPGRPTTKTQYDLAHERRLDLHRRLVDLPRIARESARKASALDTDSAGNRLNRAYVEVLQAVIADSTVPLRKRASEALVRIARAGITPTPVLKTIRRHLRQLEAGAG